MRKPKCSGIQVTRHLLGRPIVRLSCEKKAHAVEAKDLFQFGRQTDEDRIPNRAFQSLSQHEDESKDAPVNRGRV